MTRFDFAVGTVGWTTTGGKYACASVWHLFRTAQWLENDLA
jgi:hypothetical protein